MSELNVKLNDRPPTTVAGPLTVGEALKQLDRDLAKQALAARVDGREVDLAFTLGGDQNGGPIHIEPVLPETRDGLDVLRHSTAHLLAAAVLDLFPGTKLGIGPALLDDPRYGFFYDVITPQHYRADIQSSRAHAPIAAHLSYRRDEIPRRGAANFLNATTLKAS